ncbi:MAG: hypothetical protein ACR2NB_12935 [Solirubrobacteraceae bacterium]
MRYAAVIIAGLLVATAGCGGGKPATTASGAAATAKPTATPAQLPGGGRVIFSKPRRRVVAFYGNPDDAELGTLGIGPPAQMAKRLKRVAKGYDRPHRPVLPAMELLASVATSAPGADGKYRHRASNAMIGRYLRAARSVGAVLILDIQPGRAEFMPEARSLRRWLRKPDVSLALDPEWHVKAPGLPGQEIGSVDATDVLAVGRWLDDLTARRNLPQKLFVVHQFTEGMVKRRDRLRPYRHLGFVLNVDGFGSQVVKSAKYRAFAKLVPFAFTGFKLFYKEDSGLMTPRQVLRLRPAPDMVVYE